MGVEGVQSLVNLTAERQKILAGLVVGWMAEFFLVKWAGAVDWVVGCMVITVQAWVLGCVVGWVVLVLVALLAAWVAPDKVAEQLVQLLEQERLELERLKELRQELRRKLRQMQKPPSLEQAQGALADDLELALSGEPKLDLTIKHGGQDSLAKTIPNEFVRMWYVK